MLDSPTRLSAAVLLLAAASCASPPRSEVLRASTYIEADYADVWDRFTRADQYEAWYSTPCLEFGDEPGDPVRWGDGERVFYEGRLARIDAGSGLEHTFQFVGFGFDEPPTRVEIGIAERGDTVLVQVRHGCTQTPRTGEMISSVGWTSRCSAVAWRNRGSRTRAGRAARLPPEFPGARSARRSSCRSGRRAAASRPCRTRGQHPVLVPRHREHEQLLDALSVTFFWCRTVHGTTENERAAGRSFRGEAPARARCSLKQDRGPVGEVVVDDPVVAVAVPALEVPRLARHQRALRWRARSDRHAVDVDPQRERAEAARAAQLLVVPADQHR
ncbi:MAG: hypothetical protein GY711_32700 [bacterium]|nr:hypothetical protein [bacterium]